MMVNEDLPPGRSRGIPWKKGGKSAGCKGDFPSKVVGKRGWTLCEGRWAFNLQQQTQALAK
jgi:hypothetical protein